MENRLRFEVQDDFGCFVYPDERFAPLLDEFDDLLDAHQSGEMNDKRYIAELNRLIGLEPDFIDLHAHLSFTFLEQDKPQKSLDAALTGLATGNRLIPEGFSGVIEWGYVENRPYLRALQGAMLAYVRLRRHKDAVTLIDKMLTYTQMTIREVDICWGRNCCVPVIKSVQRIFLMSTQIIIHLTAMSWLCFIFLVKTGLKQQQHFDRDSVQTVTLPKCFAVILIRYR